MHVHQRTSPKHQQNTARNMYDVLRQLFSGISWFSAGGNLNATCSFQVHTESTLASYNENTSRWTGAVSFQVCVQSNKKAGPEQKSEHNCCSSACQTALVTAVSNPPAALALTAETYKHDEQQIQSFRKCLARKVTWDNLAVSMHACMHAKRLASGPACCKVFVYSNA